MHEFDISIAIIGSTVLVMGLIAGYVRNRLWVSETTVCLLIGIAVGPTALNIASFVPENVDHDLLLMEAARLTLAMAVMGAALRLPTGFEMRHAKGLFAALGIGLPLMLLAGAALSLALFPVSLLTAVLLGAILAPTDPVVAGSVVTGKLASQSLPARLRHVLTAESGANDGLGLLFVMLPVLLLQQPTQPAIGEWLLRVLVWEICGSLVLGAVAGWLTGRILMWAYRQPFSETHSLTTIGIALSLTVLSAVRLMGSDGILAVFVAGLMLKRAISERETSHEPIQAAIGRFFDLPVFVLIGATIPWDDWLELGWRGPAFVLLVLGLRRLPWWFALRPLMPEIRSTRDALFVGWFGPMGVASVYYAIMATMETGIDILWPVASLTVCASVIAHGISGTPLTRIHGARAVKMSEHAGRQ